MHLYIFKFICIRIYVYMYIYMYVHMYTFVCLCVYIYIYMCMYIYLYICVSSYIYEYIYIYTCYIYINAKFTGWGAWSRLSMSFSRMGVSRRRSRALRAKTYVQMCAYLYVNVDVYDFVYRWCRSFNGWACPRKGHRRSGPKCG